MKRAGEGDSGLVFREPLIFDRGHAGEQGYSLPEWGEDDRSAMESIPSHLLREEVEGLPQVSEAEVVRHFTRLSQWNFCSRREKIVCRTATSPETASSA